MPGKPILVGLWPAEDAILTDEALRRQVGADFYVVSLRQAVEVCLAFARGEPPATPERPTLVLPPARPAESGRGAAA